MHALPPAPRLKVDSEDDGDDDEDGPPPPAPRATHAHAFVNVDVDVDDEEPPPPPAPRGRASAAASARKPQAPTDGFRDADDDDTEDAPPPLRAVGQTRPRSAAGIGRAGAESAVSTMSFSRAEASRMTQVDYLEALVADPAVGAQVLVKIETNHMHACIDILLLFCSS